MQQAAHPLARRLPSSHSLPASREAGCAPLHLQGCPPPSPGQPCCPLFLTPESFVTPRPSAPLCQHPHTLPRVLNLAWVAGQAPSCGPAGLLSQTPSFCPFQVSPWAASPQEEPMISASASASSWPPSHGTPGSLRPGQAGTSANAKPHSSRQPGPAGSLPGLHHHRDHRGPHPSSQDPTSHPVCKSVATAQARATALVGPADGTGQHPTCGPPRHQRG